jgi:hypothetical protein
MRISALKLIGSIIRRKRTERLERERKLETVTQMDCPGVSPLFNFVNIKEDHIYYTSRSGILVTNRFPNKDIPEFPEVRNIILQHFSDGSTEVLCPYAHTHYLGWQDPNEYTGDKMGDKFCSCRYHKSLMETDPRYTNLREPIQSSDFAGLVLGMSDKNPCPYFRRVHRLTTQEVASGT